MEKRVKHLGYQEIILTKYGPRQELDRFRNGLAGLSPFKLGTRTPERNAHLMITNLRDLAEFEDLEHFPTPRFEYSPFRGAHLPLKVGSKINNYLRLYDIKRKRRYQANIGEYYISMRAYLRFLLQLEKSFGKYFESLDDEVILKATAPLSFLSPNHYDMDEKGVFGIRRTYRFPQPLVDFVIEDMTSLLPKEPVTELSMKRGTNLGWPTPKAGRSRDESDLLLMLHAAYAQGCKQRSMTLAQALDQLQSVFGPCFTIAGERFQDTERILPNIYEGSTIISDHGGVRTRGIYFSPKFMVIWNRKVVKTVLKALLQSDNHKQDRAFLRKYLTRNWAYSISIDVSAFDQSFGNGAQDQAHYIIASLASRAGLGDKFKIMQDLNSEFRVPNVIPTTCETYLSEGGEILSSGLAATSLINTFSSHMILYELLHKLTGYDYKTIRNDHLTEWVGFTWGDDVILCLDRQYLNKIHQRVAGAETDDFVLEGIKSIGKEMQLKFDAEPTRKFLGQHYHIGDYKSATATRGIPVGRWVQRQFFPERLKTYPFDRIGLLARLYMLGDDSIAKELLSILKNDFGLGTDVTYTGDSIKDMMPFVKEAVEYADSIKDLDDVINTFTHGLDEFDTDFSLAEVFGDEFVDLLGAQQIRVDDVSQWLNQAENRGKGSNYLHETLINLSKSSNPTMFSNAVVEIARIYNVNTPYTGRDLYY